MERILLWPPLLWSVRILLVLYAAGLAYVSALFLARFLRPGNAWSLMSGGLPEFARVGGTAKVMGQELTLSADVQGTDGDRLTAVEAKLSDLRQQVQDLSDSVARLERNL